MIENEDDGGAFEMSIRVLGNEFIGFVMNVDDFKTKWIVLGLAAFGGIMAIVATFGPAIKDLFTL
jgi:hypothetical protein